nr:carboxypeptidase B-like [Penaeus vannamei]
MTVMALSLVILSLVMSAATTQASTRHEALRGHQIWQLSGDIGAVPLDLMQKGLLDVLDHSRISGKVRVPFQSLEEARRILQERGVAYEILIEDLATFLEVNPNETGVSNIHTGLGDTEFNACLPLANGFPKKDQERRTKESAKTECCDPNACPRPFTDSYMTFEQMEWFLKLCESSPRATLASIGKTSEMRDIWMVHLRPPHPEETAGAVWVEAGIHAREWISSAVTLHLLVKLLQDGGDIGNFDAHVVPMANPDGYEYSRMYNRFWRKNRRKTTKAYCLGVDLNRNWNFHYGTGAPDLECSEVFKGTESFSEPETKALRDAMTRVKDWLKLVLCLHSYGQRLLYPWGYSKNDEAPHTDDLVRVGKKFVEAAQNCCNTSYTVSNVAADLYVASGTTQDWSKGVLGVKYTYTIELRDKGEYGFLLGPNNILPCSEEVWTGFQALMKKIL